MSEMLFIKYHIREQRRMEQERETARQRREEKLDDKFAVMTYMLFMYIQYLNM